MGFVLSVSTYTYVFVREDLNHATRIVQAAHAAFEMGRDLSRPSQESIDNLIVIGVKDRTELESVASELDYRGIRHHMFFEPDYNLGHTAICSEPVSDSKKKIFRKYKLLS